MSQTSAADTTQSIVARVAGAALFLGPVVVIPVTYFTILQYNIADITVHLNAYRFALACNVFYVLDILVVSSLLFVILKPVNRSAALTATFFRLMSAVGWGAQTLMLLNVLSLLGQATYLSAIPVKQLDALAKLQFAYGGDAYYIMGLPAWGLASTIFGILWLKSRYIPKALAICGIVTSVWAVFCGFGYIAVPHFAQIVNAYLFDIPMILFELILGLWLLVRGLRLHEEPA